MQVSADTTNPSTDAGISMQVHVLEGANDKGEGGTVLLAGSSLGAVEATLIWTEEDNQGTK